MDMNEWLVGLNDPQNASTKPPLGVVPGKDTVFDDDRPPFFGCIIDIQPPMPNPVVKLKRGNNIREATVLPDDNGLIV